MEVRHQNLNSITGAQVCCLQIQSLPREVLSCLFLHVMEIFLCIENVDGMECLCHQGFQVV